MATAGMNVSANPTEEVPDQAQGAEHGLPPSQIKGEGGTAHVQVSSDVAERFEAAKESAAKSTSGPSVDLNTHKSGMEPVSERARNLTAVAEAHVQSGGEAQTRTPDIGFPAGPNVH